METVVSEDGTTIAYDKTGSGPALVLVAGASCARDVNLGFAAAFAEHFTVYNYDRRGRGDSTDTAPYAVGREVEDLETVIAATGETPVLIGFSSGAALAALAVAAGSDVRKLVLWEAPYSTDPDGPRRAKEYEDELTKRLSEGRNGDASELFMQLVGIPDEMIAGMRQAPFWAGMEAVAPTLAYDAAVMGDSTVPTDQYATIAVPTLVLDGGASPQALRSGSVAVADAVPGSTYKTLDGQEHNVAPEALVPAVVEFCR